MHYNLSNNVIVFLRQISLNLQPHSIHRCRHMRILQSNERSHHLSYHSCYKSLLL